MKIQAKILLFAAALLCSVVGVIAVNLFWFERSHIRAESSERVDAIIDSVGHMAQESLRAGDDLMLLGYLKHLTKDYPEIEQAVVHRKGHTAVMGQPESKLYYRSILIPGPEEAARGIEDAGNVEIPQDGVAVQLGFSEPALESRIRKDQRALLFRVALIAFAGLLFGLVGFWWISGKIAKPITELAARMRGSWEINQSKKHSAHGDEISYLETQYATMAAKIKESAQFKEDLLLTLTHELNNPLAGLKALLWSIRNSKTRPDINEVFADCDTMAGAVDVMELSLSNTLQMFKLGAKPALKPERLAVNDVIEQVLQLLGPVAQAKNITLEQDLPQAPSRIYGDPELVRRIVINLISNACKYTPAGGAVRVQLKDFEEKVELLVADNGPGISPADRELIFTKFYRVPGADGKQQRIPGSGLGLAITKQSVDLHKGRIWVEGEMGKGSCFHVILPKERR